MEIQACLLKREGVVGIKMALIEVWEVKKRMSLYVGVYELGQILRKWALLHSEVLPADQELPRHGLGELERLSFVNHQLDAQRVQADLDVVEELFEANVLAKLGGFVVLPVNV